MENKELSGRKIKKIKVKLLEIEEQPLVITTPFIKLDAALKFSGIAETGGHAKILVEDGRIRVNGAPCEARGKKLYPGDSFEYKNRRYIIRQAYADQ